jgi:hypothetical protein
MDHLPWKIAAVAPGQQEAGWDFLRSSRGLNALSALVRGMGAMAKKEGIPFGMRDATRVMHLWYQNTPPVTRVEQIGFAFVKSPKGRRALDALVRGIAESLRGSGAQVGYQNVGEVLTSFMAGGKMASNELIWKESAAVAPAQQAKDQAQVLLMSLLRDPQFDGWTEVISKRVLEYSHLVTKYRVELKSALAQVEDSPWRIAEERLQAALKDSAFVFHGRVEALHADVLDWAEKLGGDLKEAQRIHGLVRTLLELGPEHTKWVTPTFTSKGKTKLGTRFTFDVQEITRNGVTWKSYTTEVDRRFYRVAPTNPMEKQGWRLDKSDGPIWEAANSTQYAKPQDAAKALEEMFPAPEDLGVRWK